MSRILRFSLKTVVAVLVVTSVGWYWLLHTSSGAKYVWSFIEERAPGILTTVSIVGDLSGGVKLTGIRFRNDDVQVAAQETRLALAIDLVPLSVELAELEVNTVEVRLRDDRDEEKSKKFDIAELLTALRLPIRLGVPDVRLTNLNFAMPDQESQVLISSLKMAGWLHDDLQVDRLDLVTPFADVHSSLALELQPPFAIELQADAIIKDVAESTTNLDIRAFGTIEQYAINAAAEIKMQNIGALVVNVAGKGTPQQFKINEATARGDRIDASATGELGWSDGLYLLADVEMTVPDTYIYISGNGQFDARTNVVDGALTWRGIQWPFGTDTPAFVSDSGEINVRGNPAAWVVDGTISLQTGALPQGNLTISGNGDRDAIALTIHDSDILGGRVRGHGNYRWRDGRPFNGRLRIDQIQTAELSSDWPGILSGDVDIEGTTQPFAINIDIAKLQGEIREQSVAAHGAMSIAPGSIGFRKFDLTHGDTEVVLDGQLYAAEGVTYRLNVADVGDYTDAARGALEGSGKVSLNKSSPRLRGNLMATEIAIGDIEIASLHIEDNAVHNNEFINQTIVARGLRVNTHTFDTVSISAIGDKDRHDLEIDLKSNYVGASLEASGALVDWQQLATMGWQGEISELQFEFSDDLTIALNSPVSVDVSGNEVLLEQSCLDIQGKEALCLRAHWIKATSVDLAAELHSVPLSTLMLLVDTDVEFTQEISGQLSWSSAGSALTDALTNIEITPGRIVSTYDSRLSMDTGKGILDFQVIDGALGSGTFDLPIPGYGAVDIEFQVDDLSLGANSPLSGSALIDMSDINILAELFPFIDSDGGRLAANLSVGGSLSSPSVEGEVTLRDATFRYRPFGTTLSDLQIDAVILANNQVDLEGRFKAGEGTGTVVTSAAYEAGDIPDLEFEITGSNLLLIDDPEIRVIGDPDIRISIHDRALQLDGKIRIPEADVTPSVLPQAPISESDDVTIVAGDSPDDGRTAGDEQKFRINGSLEVEFGDNVNVDLDIATANLGGSVVFEWRDEFMPTATGTFMVDGTIAAVGQVLTVHEGAISFPGVPADNPHLNIAAERVIFGNTQVKTAGILLTGTAKKPIVEAYTYPLTTEERALALLATGSDFDYEQGVGALDFGVYIAPRIYLSYGIGVFDRDNIISARYDLKRGFGVRASSGRRESGVDVSYRVDK